MPCNKHPKGYKDGGIVEKPMQMDYAPVRQVVQAAANKDGLPYKAFRSQQTVQRPPTKKCS